MLRQRRAAPELEHVRHDLHPRRRSSSETLGDLDFTLAWEGEMQELTAEHATLLLQSYLGALKTESRLTREVLAAVPAEKADYRPDPVSKSALELVRHIASADNRFVEAVITGVFDLASGIPDAVQTPAQIATWYAERHARNFEALLQATPEQLLKMVDFRGLMQRPAVTFLMIGLHHTIHHRGQLSSYLRCMGARVPAIYGESYDSAEAKKAAQA
jgi:uncharacterized damage-inducible protein DinB